MAQLSALEAIHSPRVCVPFSPHTPTPRSPWACSFIHEWMSLQGLEGGGPDGSMCATRRGARCARRGRGCAWGCGAGAGGRGRLQSSRRRGHVGPRDCEVAPPLSPWAARGGAGGRGGAERGAVCAAAAAETIVRIVARGRRPAEPDGKAPLRAASAHRAGAGTDGRTDERTVCRGTRVPPPAGHPRPSSGTPGTLRSLTAESPT